MKRVPQILNALHWIFDSGPSAQYLGELKSFSIGCIALCSYHWIQHSTTHNRVALQGCIAVHETLDSELCLVCCVVLHGPGAIDQWMPVEVQVGSLTQPGLELTEPLWVVM